MNRIARPAACLALALCLSSVIGFGAALDGYSQVRHPVALLGARDIVHAAIFNALGFVLPGLLVALVAIALRTRLDGAGWAARIGARMWLLSALAFAAQGLWPLDPTNLDAPASRVHAALWSLWWVAFVPGAGLLAMGLPRGSGRHVLALAAAVAAVLVALFAVFAPYTLAPAGVAQRLALAAWFGFFVVAAY
jgi:hypothetical protein